jgi:hypothetical protein
MVVQPARAAALTVGRWCFVGELHDVSFTLSAGDLAQAGGQWHSFGSISFRVACDRKSPQAPALYWHLRRAVEQRIRLSPTFEPIFVAEQAVFTSCARLLGGLEARDIHRQWLSIVEEASRQTMMDEQLLLVAREFVDGLCEVLETEKNLAAWRRIVDAVPALHSSAPILMQGCAKLLGRSGAPLAVLVLTAQRLEVHQELLDVQLEAPYRLLSSDMVSNIETVESWAGKTAGRSGMASSTTLRLKLKEGTWQTMGEEDGPLGIDLWFDPGSADAMRTWKTAIESAIGAVAADPLVGEQREVDEDEHTDERMSRIDERLGRQVREIVERAILGPHTQQLFACSEAVAELSSQVSYRVSYWLANKYCRQNSCRVVHFN